MILHLWSDYDEIWTIEDLRSVLIRNPLLISMTMVEVDIERFDLSSSLKLVSSSSGGGSSVHFSDHIPDHISLTIALSSIN